MIRVNIEMNCMSWSVKKYMHTGVARMRARVRIKLPKDDER